VKSTAELQVGVAVWQAVNKSSIVASWGAGPVRQQMPSDRREENQTRAANQECKPARATVHEAVARCSGERLTE